MPSPVTTGTPTPNTSPVGGTAGAAYLGSRGISVDVADAAGARFAPRWYGRPAVTFPVRDQAGAIVAYEGRYIDAGESPKGKSMGTKGAGVFLGAPDALIVNPLVIVEGPIDVLSLAEAGIPALALCGVRWPAWLPKAAAFRDVLLALDNDETGQRASKELAHALTLGSRAKRLKPRGHKDWNEVLQAEGAAWLGRHVFDRVAGALYQVVYRRMSAIFDGPPPSPHGALTDAIDCGDWRAFDRELRIYEGCLDEQPDG